MTNGKGSRDRVSDRARFGRNWDYYERRVKARRSMQVLGICRRCGRSTLATTGYPATYWTSVPDLCEFCSETMVTAK